jgi:F-box protein 18 (helicase)
MHKETPEQAEIKGAHIDLKEVISIQAYAGTGKTYILKELAKRLQRTHPTWSILYLAFNSDIVKEAREVFPRNVAVMTTHSLANRAVGFKYFKANKVAGGVRKTTIRSACREWVALVAAGDITYKDPVHKLWCDTTRDIEWGLSNTVWATLNKYLYSGEAHIEKDHICPIEMSNVTCVIKHATIIKMAEYLWERMQDLEDTFKITHDGYLKLYQLSTPQLHLKHQVIMFDEAQDANGATLSILDNAECCRIYVGDPHQQIYSWRGSINAFGHIAETTTQEYRLSQSFRFGRSIARYATGILYAWKQEDLPVKGSDGAGGVATLNTTQQQGVLDIKHTYLCRLNSSIFRRAVSYLDHCKFGFAGEKSKHKDLFNDILDVYYLHIQDYANIKSPFIRGYGSFEALQVYAIQSEDYEITGLCTIVKTYHSNIPSLLNRIWEQALPEKAAHITLTTGHRSKGREWPYVVICEDFADKFREKRSKPGEERSVEVSPCRYSYERTEEANLLYVAITRAQHTVYLPEVVADMIKDHVKYSEQVRGDKLPEADYDK